MRLRCILAFSILWFISCQTDSTSPAVEFTHAVASGDPDSDGFIIWTRALSPEDSVALQWQVAKGPGFDSIVRSGTVYSRATDDYTAKTRVEGLAPDTYYYYRFMSGVMRSPIGRSKTAPKESDEIVSFAVVSCSNYEAGYFNAYEAIAREKDIDAVIHLGDYIYELPTGVYGDTSLGRNHQPAGELISLEDYRTRYATYRGDSSLQKAHSRHPFITIWDDHEIANNAYRSGAENHQPKEEGEYSERKRHAVKAYNEWLPVRPVNGHPLYSTINYGTAHLILLDERLAGRSEQKDNLTSDLKKDSTQTILGSEQRRWFKRQLTSHPAPWTLVCNQVLFSPLDLTSIYGAPGVNPDAWDGYPYDQKRVMNWVKDNSMNNILFVTGDTHASWLFEWEGQSRSKRSWRLLEMGTPSISSPNADESHPIDSVERAEQLLSRDNSHLNYVNLRDHGYLLVEIRPDSLIGRWKYVSSLRSPDFELKTARVVRYSRK